MKRFHFRLERVLSLKEQRERLAEMRQQQARARWEEARVECGRIEGELAHAAANTAARLREATALGTWQVHYEQAARLDELLAAAQQRLAEAQGCFPVGLGENGLGRYVSSGFTRKRRRLCPRHCL
jgi:flagellar biosynthesis chaperone FliJ